MNGVASSSTFRTFTFSATDQLLIIDACYVVAMDSIADDKLAKL